MRALVLATHAPPTVAVTLVATLLAVSAGVTPGRVVLLCAAVLAGQASIGWSNDWLDADRDRAVGRTDKPVVQGGVRPELLRSAAHQRRRGRRRPLAAARPRAGTAAAHPRGEWLGLQRRAEAHLAVVAGLRRRVRRAAGRGGGRGAGNARWLPGGWSFAGAALGGAAHLANVAPDLEDDLATGVRGLPHRLGARLSGARSARSCWEGRRSPSCSDRTVLRRRPAGSVLALAVPAVVVAALAGNPGSGRPRSRPCCC